MKNKNLNRKYYILKTLGIINQILKPSLESRRMGNKFIRHLIDYDLLVVGNQ
jgi:hypothetical protein